MAESELVLRRLIQTPQRLQSIFLSIEKFQRMRSALEALPRSIPVYVATLELMHEIAAFHIHRGVLAAGSRLPAERLSLDAVLSFLNDRASMTLLAAEGITNVDNMGALFRNAAAFGVAAI